MTQENYDQIVLIAHSIGSQLLMETLRQTWLQSNHTIMNRIGAVLLISPDIDTNQLQRIKPLP